MLQRNHGVYAGAKSVSPIALIARAPPAWIGLKDTGKACLHDMQEEDLIRLFGGGRGAGGVTAVRVVRDAKSSKGKGIAYVEFGTRNEARMALGFDGHTLNGRAIRVSRVTAGERSFCGIHWGACSMLPEMKVVALVAGHKDPCLLAGPGSAEQQHGVSSLRTPYSKGIRLLQSFLSMLCREYLSMSCSAHQPIVNILDRGGCAVKLCKVLSKFFIFCRCQSRRGNKHGQRQGQGQGWRADEESRSRCWRGSVAGHADQGAEEAGQGLCSKAPRRPCARGWKAAGREELWGAAAGQAAGQAAIGGSAQGQGRAEGRKRRCVARAAFDHCHIWMASDRPDLQLKTL